jgi:hypothetical protein
MKPPRVLLAAALLAACSHSETYSIAPPYNGPNSSGPTVRLTFNSEQDYWPALTQDGQAFLYAYVDPVDPLHRCVGLQRGGGGTRIWSMCDQRAVASDSASSFAAYALGSDGRLLYVEAVAGMDKGVPSLSPDHTTLWLADSATPFHRRALLTLPVQIGTIRAFWLQQLSWTGPTTFVALAQGFDVTPQCRFCAPYDTLFSPAGIVSGSISDIGAAMQLIPGTEGASGYSLAEGGQSIVFTKRADSHLYRVPAGGGTATQVANIALASAAEFLGISCLGTTCVVATDDVTLASGEMFPSAGSGPNQLTGVSITTGMSQVLKSFSSPTIATPLILPGTGDVVVQLGGGFGYLQTFSASGDIYLYQGLVQ